MKRIVYSTFTKITAVILLIVFIVLGVLTVTDGIADYYKEKAQVYRFERDYSESSYLAHYLYEPENAVFNAYPNYYHADGQLKEIDMDSVEKNIEEKLTNQYCADKINYFVEWNDRIFTNCNAVTPQELTKGELYVYAKREGINVEREANVRSRYGLHSLEEISHLDKTSSITVCANIKQEYLDTFKALWEHQESIVLNALRMTLYFVLLSLLLLVYLVCVCGKDGNGEQKTTWIDKIWMEIHLAAIALSGIGAVYLCVVVIDEYQSSYFSHDLTYMSVISVTALASVVIITSLLSVIRNIKCGTLVKTSIVFSAVKIVWRICVKAVKLCWRIFVKTVKFIYGKCRSISRTALALLSKKAGIILIAMLLVYTAIIGIAGVFAIDTPMGLVLGIVTFAFASFVIAYRSKDLDEVKKGASQVRGGNLSYKIPQLRCEDLRVFAEDINSIAKGLDESVAAKVKAERLKTELITNVSHDLKTPITSIINYTELLSKIDDLPEEARDYIKVIAQKSQRLKNLTRDLFDISKVQSGNETPVLEKLDMALLVNQSLGEHDSDIKNSGMHFCVDIQKDMYVYADGRKMSRVISNLIDNILKYSLKNTRVFISVFEKGGDVVTEFKNIASYPMEFTAEEIVGRFVQGDKSRTTEGNGLGLAIAKSYTEICNGKFQVVTDGDMFKVIIVFKRFA